MSETRHLGRYEAIVCDIDGVLHVGGDPLPGAAAWIRTVQALGVELLLVTNASWERGVTLARLAHAGIRVPWELVVTSGQAVVTALEETGVRRATVFGAGSVVESLVGSAITLVSPEDLAAHPHTGAVVVGAAADPAATREWMERYAALGIPAFSTNRDMVYADTGGLEPGTGSLVDRLEQQIPGLIVQGCGKPYQPMAQVVRRHLGGLAPVLVVGDNPDVDVAFARRLGADSLLVLTGTATDAGDSRPTMVVDDLERALEMLGVVGLP